MLKRKKKIIIIILCILIVSVAAIGVYQKNNIKAAYVFWKYSSDDISSMEEKNNEHINDALKKVDEVTVRDLTDDEKAAIETGELSEDDAVTLITTPSDTTKPESPAGKDPAGESTANAEVNSKLSSLVAQIYVLKASYTSKLNAMVSSAKAEYLALPEAERTESAKLSIGKKYLSKAGELEKNCDAKVSGICGEIKTLLKESGGDTSLVEDIQSAYRDEKALKKAYYLSLYN